MSQKKNIQIILDNASNTYFSGAAPLTVAGKVIVTTKSTLEIRGIFVNVKGRAKVRWSETKGRTTVFYTNHENFFKQTIYLVGGPKEKISLPVGEVSYPISSQLPAHMPSSFDSPHGKIHYTINVVIDIIHKFNSSHKMRFTIIAPLDLNTHQMANRPVRVVELNTFGCCCCKSEPLSVVAGAPKRGYIPGDQIPLTVEVDNKSTIEITNVKVKLKMVVTCRASLPFNKTREDKTTLTTEELGAVGKQNAKTFTVTFQIPATVPFYNVDKCHIIDIDYVLMVEAVAKGLHLNVDVCLPLVLGTVTEPAHPVVQHRESIRTNPSANDDDQEEGMVESDSFTYESTGSVSVSDSPPFTSGMDLYSNEEYTEAPTIIITDTFTDGTNEMVSITVGTIGKTPITLVTDSISLGHIVSIPVSYETTDSSPGRSVSLAEILAGNERDLSVPVTRGRTTSIPISYEATESFPDRNVSLAEILSRRQSMLIEASPVASGAITTIPITYGTTESIPITNDTTDSIPITNGTTVSILITNETTESIPITNGTTVSIPSTNDTTEIPITNETTISIPITNETTDSIPITDDTTESIPIIPNGTSVSPVTNETVVEMPAGNDEEVMSLNCATSEVIENIAQDEVDSLEAELPVNGALHEYVEIIQESKGWL